MPTFIEKLEAASDRSNSLVCVGLDSDLTKIPKHLQTRAQPIFEFNKAIIDATHDLVCCYKPQLAYYSAQRTEDQLEQSLAYLRETYPGLPVILDSKRGDIGNTAEYYAAEAFDRYAADAVTVSPYLGGDTLEPFLKRADRGVIVLCRTSNPGSGEFQDLEVNGEKLYRIVARRAATAWSARRNVLLVVGATYPDELAAVRSIVGEMTLLIPGIGAQGGDIEATVKAGQNSSGRGIIVSSSRAVIYASSGEAFADDARAEALRMRDALNSFRIRG